MPDNVSNIDRQTLSWIYGPGSGVIGKAKKKARNKYEKAYEEQYGAPPGDVAYGIPKEQFVRETSLNDQDVAGMINMLVRNIGTQVSEAQNRRQDLLYDAPLATREAAMRGAEIRGNQAVADTTEQIQLEQKKSKVNATANFYSYAVDEEKLNRELAAAKEARESNLIGDLFGAVGSAVGLGLFKGSGTPQTGQTAVTPNVQDFNYTQPPISPLKQPYGMGNQLPSDQYYQNLNF